MRFDLGDEVCHIRMAKALEPLADADLANFKSRLDAYSDDEFVRVLFLGTLTESDAEALRREQLRREHIAKAGTWASGTQQN